MSEFRPAKFNILPAVVKNLLILNGLMFFALITLNQSFGIDLTRILGLHFFGSEYFMPHQFITHLFMHGGLMHLALNMFALWMFGSVLENVWGPKRFLIFYFVTGLGAAALHLGVTTYDLLQMKEFIRDFASDPSLGQYKEFINSYVPNYYEGSFKRVLNTWAMNPENSSLQNKAVQLMRELFQLKKDVPTVGASGAVYGVLLAFGMLFPNTRIYLYFLFPIKAKYFVMIIGAFELYSGFTSGPSSTIANFAHLGGMLFGYLLIKYWNRTNRKDFF